MMSVEGIEARLRPLRERLEAHSVYESIQTIDDLKIFMESHVFAVWDFMSLLKSLQASLTCVAVPWVPTKFAASRRFINEMVLGEESDLYQGRPVSHFEVYLDAMERIGADTSIIWRVVQRAPEKIELSEVPAGASHFVASTFRTIGEGSVAAQAAAFTFGREDAIPGMFRALVRSLNRDIAGELDPLVWYLERHIEVDAEDHGPIALRMVADLCGEDAALWEEAARAAEEAIRARLTLWDAILQQMKDSHSPSRPSATAAV